MSRHDRVEALAARVADASRPLLIGLDIDGVLAPIVAHADHAALIDGVAEALSELCQVPDVFVAAVSGRAVASMLTFGLPDDVRLVGSHGLEEHGRPMDPLTDQEMQRLDALRALAQRGADDAGPGAWVEEKSASVALHIRQANAATGTTALEKLGEAARAVEGATAKPGTQVLELFTRHASKGTAMQHLIEQSGAATAVFVGDDLTDEEAFAALRDGDISIKVGDADTIAQHRLGGPTQVRAWLRELAERFDDEFR